MSTQPNPPPAAEPPAATKVVATGKTERELLLERENKKLREAVTKTAAAKRKAEIDAGHKANELDRFKQAVTPPPATPPPAKEASWGFFQK